MPKGRNFQCLGDLYPGRLISSWCTVWVVLPLEGPTSFGPSTSFSALRLLFFTPSPGPTLTRTSKHLVLVCDSVGVESLIYSVSPARSDLAETFSTPLQNPQIHCSTPWFLNPSPPLSVWLSLAIHSSVRTVRVLLLSAIHICSHPIARIRSTLTFFPRTDSLFFPFGVAASFLLVLF